jgi:hypothetical protein
MKNGFRILTALRLVTLTGLAAGPQLSTPPVVPADPAAAGRELVARLLAIQPAASETNRATLQVRSRKGVAFEVPVEIAIQAGGTRWSMTYRTTGSNAAPTAAFTVIHRADGPNEYRVARPGAAETNTTEVLAGPAAFVPFAGSDFDLADLGMEFLHWPTQRLLQKEICRGQSCDKLESVAPAGWTNGYVRVVAWFDIDTGGPVLVEAYDAAGRNVKEFKPNDFKKVNGQWQVSEMEMSNFRTGSRTTLHFQFDPP